ncbi:hypothetical protein OG698_30235 [Streptomyces sp. NBC_01003]|nr:hypothetical protein OG698_30235 [Streptomyces sp. NBC_01003]
MAGSADRTEEPRPAARRRRDKQAERVGAEQEYDELKPFGSQQHLVPNS